MDESVSEEGRRQSILKPKTRFPLQEVQAYFPDDETVTSTFTRSRRVSFGRNVVKEFLIGSAVSTQAVDEYEQSSDSLSEPSECSGPLDLAIDKSCRNEEAQTGPEDQIKVTQVETDPEQRARLFTENCISIAKSVFKDNETEMTAIIIGAKPMDGDRKNSSSMSFTTLDMSHVGEVDHGHRPSQPDFLPMRHPDLFNHSAHPVDKSRFDFLDKPSGNVSLPLGPSARLSRQGARTPLACLPHFAPWDDDNEENIPPAHTSLRQAPTAHAHPVYTCETTMELTCANLRGNRSAVALNSTARDVTFEDDTDEEGEVDDPLRLGVSRDDFLSDLSGLEGNGGLSPSNSDDGTLTGLHQQLANLSQVNQSFRERLQTLPGVLNASHVNNNTDNFDISLSSESPLSQVLSPAGEVSGLDTTVEMECATPIPKSLANQISNKTTCDDENMTETCVSGWPQARPVVLVNGDEMELTASKITAWCTSDDELDPLAQGARAANHSIFSPDQSGTCQIESIINESLLKSPTKTIVGDDVDMEFTHCNAGMLRATTEATATISPHHSTHLPIVQVENQIDLAERVSDTPLDTNPVDADMEFTHCNAGMLQTEAEAETIPSSSDSIDSIAQVDNQLDLTGMAPLGGEEASGANKSFPTNTVDDDVDMEFTHCNAGMLRHAAEGVAENPVDVPLAQVDNQLDLTGMAPLGDEEASGANKSFPTNTVDDDVDMEFTHCNAEMLRHAAEGVAETTPSSPQHPIDSIIQLDLTGMAPLGDEVASDANNSCPLNTQDDEIAEAAAENAADAPWAPLAQVLRQLDLTGMAGLDATEECNANPVTTVEDDLNGEEALQTANIPSEPILPSTEHQDNTWRNVLLEQSVTPAFTEIENQLDLTAKASLGDEQALERNQTLPADLADNDDMELRNAVMLRPAEDALEPLDSATDHPIQNLYSTHTHETASASETCMDPPAPIGSPVIMPPEEDVPEIARHPDTDVSMDMTIHTNDAVNPQITAETLPNITVENVPAPNVTADMPLNTPLAGLAALSTRPSLRDRLQAPPPDSTTISISLEPSGCLDDALRSLEPSGCLDDALRSMELTEGNMGGVVPRLMKTMSEEQHMRAVHESTRVAESPSARQSLVESDRTYPIVRTYCQDTANKGENTYTIPASAVNQNGMEENDLSLKRSHSSSPCPGEVLKKTRCYNSPRPLNLSHAAKLSPEVSLEFAAKTLMPDMDETVETTEEPGAGCPDSPLSKDPELMAHHASSADSLGKRMHSDSPLPSDRLLKKNRPSNSPRSARSLVSEMWDKEISYNGPSRYSGDLDISVTLHDVTLSGTESADSSVLQEPSIQRPHDCSHPESPVKPAPHHSMLKSINNSSVLLGAESPVKPAPHHSMLTSINNSSVLLGAEPSFAVAPVAPPRRSHAPHANWTRASDVPLPASPTQDGFTRDVSITVPNVAVPEPENHSETDEPQQHPGISTTCAQIDNQSMSAEQAINSSLCQQQMSPDCSFQPESPVMTSTQKNANASPPPSCSRPAPFRPILSTSMDLLRSPSTALNLSYNSVSKDISTIAPSQEYASLSQSDRNSQNGWKKVQGALQEQACEESSVWKLLSFTASEQGDGVIEIELPLLETGLLLSITFQVLEGVCRVTGFATAHRPASRYQVSGKVQINHFGYQTLKTYIVNEEKRVKSLEEVPTFIDFFNSFTRKLNVTMQDALIVLRGCAGARFSGHVLSFRLHSFPTLTSCWVDMDLQELLILGRPGLRFRHETGRLDEAAVRAVLRHVPQPSPLQTFVRGATELVAQQEAVNGFVTRRPRLLF